MLQDLPSSLLGAVFRAAATHSHAPDFQRLAPALNLICRAAHEALPDAFTCDDGAAQAADSQGAPPDPSPAFIFEACDTWPLPVPGILPAAVLQLNLDALGKAAYADPAAARATLRRTATRFAHARCVRLVSCKPHGVHGGALFAKHAAPLMVGVRSLFIVGPLEIHLPPYWQLFAPLVGLAAGVRELTIRAHHSTVVPLAARLPLSFPALTAAYFRAFADHRGADCWAMLAPYTAPFSAVTACVSPRLTTLLMAVHTPDGCNERDKLPFTLSVEGEPTALHCLRLHTFPSSRVLRPWLLQGSLPALRCLDVTVRPWDPTMAQVPDSDEESDEEAPPAAAVPFLQPPLRDTCPALTHIVLRSERFLGLRHWHATLEALAPLAACLVGWDVHFSRWGMLTRGFAMEDDPAELLQMVSRVLPRARPRLFAPNNTPLAGA